MASPCIISHAHVDEKIAKALATLIERVSLGGVKVWFSSDDTQHGGIGAGQNWFDVILRKLKESRVVIALLTTAGLSRPWIYFESGYAAGQEKMTVIPVAVGLDNAVDIPAPLSAYQSYALIDHRAVARFLEKLLACFDVHFDEEMSQLPIRTFVSELARLPTAGAVAANEPRKERAKAEGVQAGDIELILAHIDRKLGDFVEVARGHKNETEYAVEIDIEFPRLKNTVSISVGTSDSVQDIMDTIWMMVSEEVRPYTYLENWILVDKVTGGRLIAREIMPLVPARFVFRRELRWAARLLDQPVRFSGDGGVAARTFEHIIASAGPSAKSKSH
jgi:hypothetical protein